MELTDRLLRKAKLNQNGGMTVEWEDHFYDDVKGSTTVVSESRTSDAKVHEDLLERMVPMMVHMVCACELVDTYPSVRPSFDERKFAGGHYTAGSVTVRGGTDGKPFQVFIFGNKKLSTGHKMNFGTRGIKLDTAAEQYAFADDLDKHVEALTEEVWAYVFSGKCAPEAQTSILDPDQTSIVDEEQQVA